MAWMDGYEISFFLKSKLDSNGNLPFEVANIFNPLAKPMLKPLQPFAATINGTKTHLQLRKSLSDINFQGATLNSDPKIKTLAQSDPATFGFYRDYLSGSDTWYAEGVAAYPLSLMKDVTGEPNEANKPYFASAYLVPSVAFQRVTGTGGGKFTSEADALTFRAGLWIGFNLPQGPFESLLASLNFRESTDFSIEEWKPGVELDVEPLRVDNPSFGLDHGDVPKLEGYLKYKTRFVGHFEYADQAIQNVEVEAFRAGPRFDLSFKLGEKFGDSLQRLELFGKYNYLWTVSGGFEDVEYVETGIRMALDPAEQILLEASYKWGKIPVKFTEIDLFNVGLAVKF